MADPRRLPPVVADYVAFAALLSLRAALDIARFPVDGYARVTPVNLIEAQVFYIALHYGVYLVLRANRLPVAPASRIALVVMGLYLYLHLLEYWFPAGGRAAVYAPAGHLWENLSSAFLATGDAGFWQVMRIFVCGVLLLLVLIKRRTPWPRVLLTLPLLYLWGMLLAHPHAWLLIPPPAPGESPLAAERGVQGLVICGWALLAVTLATLLERRFGEPAGPVSWRFSAAWVAGLTLVMFWQPMIAGGGSALGLVLLQCGVIAQLALIAPGSGVAGALSVGDLVRLVTVALIGAIMAALWGLIGFPALGLIAWLVLEQRLLRSARRRTPGLGLLLGGGLGAVWIALSQLQPVLIPTPAQPPSVPGLAGACHHESVAIGKTPCHRPPMS